MQLATMHDGSAYDQLLGITSTKRCNFHFEFWSALVVTLAFFYPVNSVTLSLAHSAYISY